jgi:imidazolonepropionase-like amidohydrolase
VDNYGSNQIGGCIIRIVDQRELFVFRIARIAAASLAVVILAQPLAAQADSGGSDARISADEILTATRNAAGLLGWSDRIGTVVPGLLADLIALQGDPIARIRVGELR